MSSKKFTLLFILSCLLFGITSNVSAQFTQPYLVKEALPNVKKAATDSGWVNPTITAIATIGDTTGLGQAGALLGGGFDLKSGRSTLWVYIVSIIDGTGNTATKLLAYIKVPILGFQQVPLPADAVPGDIPFQPQDSIPTSSMLNSDAIATKINANETYQKFSKDNPKAKSSFIVLFTSPFDIPETPFSAGTSLWNFNFADQSDSLASSMSCFVNAKSGETICFESGEIVSVNEDESLLLNMKMNVHPIPHGMNGTLVLPSELTSGHLDIIDLFGRTVYSVEHIQAVSQSIQLPQLMPGVYVARLNQEGTYSSIRFIQQ
ncbi:MAG: T9SS type A sorting domain-containing protein [Ignavibacteriae bacterium]|jgi:hypothetical protein|nr:T9SS type A sorting domain-containing protein [Ignavibacteriota bacterium]